MFFWLLAPMPGQKKKASWKVKKATCRGDSAPVELIGHGHIGPWLQVASIDVVKKLEIDLENQKFEVTKANGTTAGLFAKISDLELELRTARSDRDHYRRKILLLEGK